MNTRLLLIGVAVVVVGVGGWLYIESNKVPRTSSDDARAAPPSAQGSTPVEKSAATNVPSQKQLSTTEQVTARSFAGKILTFLQNHDYGKVYDLLSDEDRVAESKTEYVKRVTLSSGSVTITRWQIKEVLEEPTGASVQYVVDYDSGVLGSGSETGILSLVQKNGKWYLSIGAADIAKAILKGVGDEVVLATEKFTVNSVREQPSISTSYGATAIAKENTKFIIVDLTVTNLTKSSFFFSEDMLIDNQGRRFETYRDTIGHINDYLMARSLSPSIPEKGVVVYEVPNDATSYGLLVTHASTNQVYKIVLK